MKPENSIELREKGYTIIRNLIDNELLDSLSNKMDVAFIKHRKTQLSNGNDIETGGVALHVNSLSALDNLPNQPNFSSLVHRDLRFYSGDFPIMVNCLLMVDGFSIENGGTYLLPGSHLEERKPTDKEFFKKAIQVVGNRGDIVIFNSNVWHSSAPNTTQNHRRAIPLTVSRSFMKQLIDYPRALGYNKMDSFTPQLQQLLGYHSRVPSSLNEWYQPENKRFYKKDQD